MPSTQIMQCGRLVEARFTNWVTCAELALEDFFDQLVVPVPARMFVDDRYEEVSIQQGLEDARSSVATHCLARRRGQLVENGGRQHELRDFLRLPVEDLLQEVAGDGVTEHVGSTDRRQPVGRRPHRE